jgi:hypothetical protein
MLKKNTEPILLEGVCARAICEAHLREEYLTVMDSELRFFDVSSNKTLRISIKGVLGCSSCDGPNFPGLHFFKVETLGREWYVMVETASDRDAWVSTIARLAKQNQTAPTEAEEEDDDVADEDVEYEEKERAAVGVGASSSFLHKSTLFKKQARLILNCRVFAFGEATVQDPLGLVEEAMVSLDACASAPTADEGGLVEFLNMTAALKRVNIHDLDVESGARVCFLLNLYHLMVNHALLLEGEERVSKQWFAHCNHICYQLGGDVFSLLELEQCIIRAGLCAPNRAQTKIRRKISTKIRSNFVRSWKQPASKYSFALTSVTDNRINFALNSGSTSNLGHVPVFRVKTLDAQLQRVAEEYCQSRCQVRREPDRLVMVVSEAFRWYRADFCSGDDESETADENQELFQAIIGLRGWDEADVEAVELAGFKTKMKFAAFQLNFRLLELKR